MAVNVGCKLFRSLPVPCDVERRLCPALVGLTLGGRRSISSSAVAAVSLTQTLCAEPLKKKKRVDPALVRAREEKQKRRLEKAIRRLEKGSRQLKPITEHELPRHVRAELRQRTRRPEALTTEAADRRFDLLKDWARHKQTQHAQDVAMFRRIHDSQQTALLELKAESYELYCAAIAMDPELVPFTGGGPTLTPPIADYDCPDGDYTDTTRKWE